MTAPVPLKDLPRIRRNGEKIGAVGVIFYTLITDGADEDGDPMKIADTRVIYAMPSGELIMPDAQIMRAVMEDAGFDEDTIAKAIRRTFTAPGTPSAH